MGIWPWLAMDRTTVPKYTLTHWWVEWMWDFERPLQEVGSVPVSKCSVFSGGVSSTCTCTCNSLECKNWTVLALTSRGSEGCDKRWLDTLCNCGCIYGLQGRVYKHCAWHDMSGHPSKLTRTFVLHAFVQLCYVCVPFGGSCCLW